MAIADRRRVFRQIIRKCVLQLLLIETTHELLQNAEVYATIPSEHLLRFLAVLEDSYQFARRFNADKDLRMALWKVGAYEACRPQPARRPRRTLRPSSTPCLTVC
jgi:brefeldin A-inhibited guanine nucleotide-exchange protein